MLNTVCCRRLTDWKGLNERCKSICIGFIHLNRAQHDSDTLEMKTHSILLHQHHFHPGTKQFNDFHSS